MFDWINRIFKKEKEKPISGFAKKYSEILQTSGSNSNESLEKKKPDFIASLTYRTTEEGGRKTAAMSGYRPAIKFPFSEMLTSGGQYFPDVEKVYPGDTVKAEIRILGVDYFKNQLYENLEFEFYEGPTLIGTGIILEILNPMLQNSSR
ncbi:hypothetical protein HUK80_06250 [Flavobacterium sp. MAH-1]|uniref:Translation elongation factor EFTu/EF1A C-terminal domain-containing protein n=1 Tax=Flavobacterium agri TaxID=2743471 RepID=A0A7Y9C524_9FLAO|nr:hypothetical protein [Flavobacterium agri]NUY80490.1 hypothetical protein [Flavobacterium agri]NYA70515.1 hypothetical protein [Flavobacterium agri]